MCSKIDDIIIIRSCYLSEQIRFMSSGLNKLSVHPERDAAIPPSLLFFFLFPWHISSLFILMGKKLVC